MNLRLKSAYFSFNILLSLTLALDLIDKVLRAEPTPFAELGQPDVPQDLETLIFRCLEKSPDKRPQSVQEVLESLEALTGVFVWRPSDAEAWWQAFEATSRSP